MLQVFMLQDGALFGIMTMLDQCLMTRAHKGQEEVVVGWGIMSLEDQSKEDHKRCNQYAKAEHRAEGGERYMYVSRVSVWVGVCA